MVEDAFIAPVPNVWLVYEQKNMHSTNQEIVLINRYWNNSWYYVSKHPKNAFRKGMEQNQILCQAFNLSKLRLYLVV